MTDYEPTLTGEADLSPSDRELTQEQRLSKAHNAATRMVIDAHRPEFNKAKADAAAALGIRWVPRKSAEEKALEEALELVRDHPVIRKQLLEQLTETEAVKAVASPRVSDSQPATAEVDGLTHSGRLSGDGKVFVYSSGDEMVRTGDFTLITVNGREVD